MKHYVLFTVCMIAITLCNAANFFVPGTVWEYNVFDTGRMYAQTCEFRDTVDSEGAPCYVTIYRSFKTDSPNPDELKTEVKGRLVKVDGEKVYLFITWMGKSEWQLVYDFSLRPGEGCWLKETHLYYKGYPDGSVEPHSPEECYFKYVGLSKSKDYNADLMELKVFRSEDDSDDMSKAIKTVYWIPGVGSTTRFDGFYYFPTELSWWDYSSILMKVTDAEGNVLVEFRDPSGIGAVEASDGNAPAQYFDLQGRRVATPGHGLYIVRQGAKASKVLL